MALFGPVAKMGRRARCELHMTGLTQLLESLLHSAAAFENLTECPRLISVRMINRIEVYYFLREVERFLT